MFGIGEMSDSASSRSCGERNPVLLSTQRLLCLQSVAINGERQIRWLVGTDDEMEFGGTRFGACVTNTYSLLYLLYKTHGVFLLTMVTIYHFIRFEPVGI